MSFAKYMALEVGFVLLLVVTLPLWIPFGAYVVVRNWWDNCRYGWECMERNREHDAKRATGVKGTDDAQR